MLTTFIGTLALKDRTFSHTRSARREAAETICLLDAIMDGLENESSGALRELCARASADFLKWSAKHIPNSRGMENSSTESSLYFLGYYFLTLNIQLALIGANHHGNNLNAASLLKRLFDRLTHPNPYKRLGAALAVRYCARILGGQEEIMQEYLLEALHFCVHALHLSEGRNTAQHQVWPFVLFEDRCGSVACWDFLKQDYNARC